MSCRTPLIIAAVYAALFIALCCCAGQALAMPDTGNRVTCREDAPCWTWSTMGNRKRGVMLKGFTGRVVVGPCEYRRIVRAGLLDTRRTPRLRGDYLARCPRA